jgi:predicted transcriptional regulator
MSMSNLIEQLQRLGFGQYEAQAYSALLSSGPQSGYELAKASGIPRANIYAVLRKLEERSAVLRLERASGVQYAPVPAQELIDRLASQYQQQLEATRECLQGVAAPESPEYVWNAHGYPALLDHARSCIEMAREQLLVVNWPQEASLIAPSIERAESRGVEVITLCTAGCHEDCSCCHGQLYRYHLAPEEHSRWLIVVQDEKELLAGEIGQADEALAVRTRQPLLVELASWYVRQSIALSAILLDLGGRLEELIQPGTQAILSALGPQQAAGGLAKYMRLLLERSVGADAQPTIES